jgi:hypothetical protein
MKVSHFEFPFVFNFQARSALACRKIEISRQVPNSKTALCLSRRIKKVFFSYLFFRLDDDSRTSGNLFSFRDKILEYFILLTKRQLNGYDVIYGRPLRSFCFQGFCDKPVHKLFNIKSDMVAVMKSPIVCDVIYWSYQLSKLVSLLL